MTSVKTVNNNNNNNKKLTSFRIEFEGDGDIVGDGHGNDNEDSDGEGEGNGDRGSVCVGSSERIGAIDLDGDNNSRAFTDADGHTVTDDNEGSADVSKFSVKYVFFLVLTCYY